MLFIIVSIVTAIRFSNDDKTRLACSSQDGNLSVFDLSTDPPSISCTLKGHTHPVNGKANPPGYNIYSPLLVTLLLLVLEYCFAVKLLSDPATYTVELDTSVI